MTSDIVISDMPANSKFAHIGAQWAFGDWKETDPNDEIEWYLNVYSESAVDPSSLPISLAAITTNGELAGVACVVADDELPDAIEPGPWVAAVFVSPECRGRAVGKQLVTEAVRRARELGHSDVYLYTRDVAHWY
ncbi:MAG: GNAT family N-acetyltransferase, partial [Ilumatobacteraceae bacterium]|nr:GNAT family N-acetyltransferase [Ilumatobacteraceae bacterium]